jgi:hypothetical protein
MPLKYTRNVEGCCVREPRAGGHVVESSANG